MAQNIALFVWVSRPAQNSNSGSANGMSLGAWPSLCSTNGRWGRVYETCLKTETSTLNRTIRRPVTPLVFSLLYLLIWFLFSTHLFHFFSDFFLSLFFHLFLIHHLFCLPSVLSFILSSMLFFFERCMAINSKVTGGLFIPLCPVRRSIGLSVKRVA